MNVQTLTPDEAPLLVALLDVFAEAFEDPEHYSSSRPHEAYSRGLLGSDSFLALVAVDERGAVAGGLTAYVLCKPEAVRSEIYLYDLAVAPEHQRRGVATALIVALKGVAAARGASVIFVQADAGDEAPMALYAKLGVREDVHHFDIAVTDSAPE